MTGAPTPTLNDTAPPVNLAQNFHLDAASGLPHINLGVLGPVAFMLLFAIWAIYSVVIVYHWMRYRHQSWFAVPALVLHFFMSGAIILFIMSSLA